LKRKNEYKILFFREMRRRERKCYGFVNFFSGEIPYLEISKREG